MPHSDWPTLADIMENHPDLTYHGLGTPHSPELTDDQRQARFLADRERLAMADEEVTQVAEWLVEHLAPIKTPNTSSYGLKHRAEDHLGRYVANGEAIAAALMAGYPHKPTAGRGSPNMMLAMSARDMKKVWSSRPRR